MTKLRMAQAPVPAIPRLFLRSAALWGVFAGALLMADGEAALASRWSGATLALVHALTLGFLGNAMFGALLQFLPVAVGASVRGGARAARILHGLLNLGVALLIAGFRWPQALNPTWGGGLLLVAFLLLAALVLPGLLRAEGERFLRQGIGLAVAAALVTATLGLLLALGWSGLLHLPQLTLTDAHAGWGLLGWVLGLLAAVARVVAPMFQGAVPAPARAQGGWQLVLYVLLMALLFCAARGTTPDWLRIALSLPMLVFAIGGLWLQLGARHLRLVPLTFFWCAGFAVLAIAGCLLLAGAGGAMMAGALVVAIGLPLLVTGMSLEIVAFLGWIELQRECGKGVHVPGVQLLMPSRDKAVVLALHLLAGLLLALAVRQVWMAAIAGAALLFAHCASFVALGGARRRGRRFIAERTR